MSHNRLDSNEVYNVVKWIAQNPEPRMLASVMEDHITIKATTFVSVNPRIIRAARASIRKHQYIANNPRISGTDEPKYTKTDVYLSQQFLINLGMWK